MATGTTNDFYLSRDEIIEQALRKVGGLALGETISGEQLQDGIKSLNGIIRALDLRDKHLWKISPDATTITIVEWLTRYTSSHGLTASMLELVSVSYRDAQGEDTPLDMITLEDYEAIANKLETGPPQVVCMQPRRAITDTPVMFVWPVLTEVNTQSVVTGTDSNPYKCIRSHTASTDNRPITGDLYPAYWESGGSSPSAWASGTAYTAPELLRLRFKSPLADFDLATDNADLPSGFGRYLVYRLAEDFADDYGLPLEERALLSRKCKMAYDEVFPYLIPDSTNYHNRHVYF